MKWTGGIILAWFVLAAVGPCTITHEFGPYFGKVVDETGQPIEGALALRVFFTVKLGGLTHNFVEALETETDRNGEFHLAPYRAWVFRFPDRWDPDGNITIFKPGYKVHLMGYIHSNQYKLFVLEKLITHEERIRNAHNAIPSGVPLEKIKHLMEAIRKEEKDMGYGE